MVIRYGLDIILGFAHRQAEGTAPEEFNTLVAVKRMVWRGAYVAEEAFQRQPFEI